MQDFYRPLCAPSRCALTILSAIIALTALTAHARADGAAFPQTDGWPNDNPSIASKLIGGAGNSKAKASSISPDSVEAGAQHFTVTVTGDGFTADTRIIINITTTPPTGGASVAADLILPTTLVSPNKVIADIPVSLMAQTVSLPIRVSNGYDDGESDPALTLKVTPATGKPIVSSIDPVGAKLNPRRSVTLTVWGQNFDKDTVVMFGRHMLDGSLISSNQIVATIPKIMLEDTGNVNVGAMNSYGASETVPFTISRKGPDTTTAPIQAAAAPVAYYITPPSVVAGTKQCTITVGGDNFTQQCKVDVGGVAAPTTFVSAQELTVSIPDDAIGGPGKVDIKVDPGNGPPTDALWLVINSPGNTSK